LDMCSEKPLYKFDTLEIPKRTGNQKLNMKKYKVKTLCLLLNENKE
jgi:hypothetical protein